MENRRRISDNIVPSDIIDLTGDDDDASTTTNTSGVQQVTNRPCTCTCPLYEQYKCPICLMLLTEPVSTACGHVFCDQCLMMALHTGVPTCPICKAYINTGQVIRIYI
nr:E3 ubiquitin-protein ligase RNF138-like [Drosophila bipectinata]